MLTGKELGAAIRVAIDKKGVTQKAVAEHFNVKPPSIQDWLNKGTIGKEKLPELWQFFSDVVGPSHWGIQAYPQGSYSLETKVNEAAADVDVTADLTAARARKWPFRHLDPAKIAALSPDDARQLEGAWRDAAKRLGLDVEFRHAGKRKAA